MKYLFLILLLGVSIGGYNFYQSQQKNHEALLTMLEDKFQTELRAALNKAEEQVNEYEQLKTKLTNLEEANDQFLKKESENIKGKIDSMLGNKELTEAPQNASRAIKKQLSDLHIENRRLRAELEALDIRQAGIENSLFGLIRKNNAAYELKEQQAHRAKMSQKPSKKISQSKSATFDEALMVYRESMEKSNANIRKKIDDSRIPYEKKKIELLKKLENNENKVYSVANSLHTDLQQNSSELPNKVDLALDSYSMNMQSHRVRFNNESKKLQENLRAQNVEIRRTIRNAEKITAAHDSNLSKEKENHETTSLYIQVIVWALSIVLVIVTLMVFLGSRKVKEESKISYY